jgi:hypothetical protein
MSGPLRRSCSEELETAVSVWQEEIWRGVSDLQRVRYVCIARPTHKVAV